MNFDLRAPCKDCPFRTDIKPFLTKGRAREICSQITRQQATFACHKTVDCDDEDWMEDRAEGPYPSKDGEQHCAGALIFLERADRPNQLMRIAERLGQYDRTKLKMDAPVFKTATAMIKVQSR